jgi:hypothetical protein
MQQVCAPGGGTFLVPVVYKNGALGMCIFSRVLHRSGQIFYGEISLWPDKSRRIPTFQTGP